MSFQSTKRLSTSPSEATTRKEPSGSRSCVTLFIILTTCIPFSLVHSAAVTKIYDGIKPAPNPYLYTGSTKEVGANRTTFGEAVNLVLDANLDRKKDVMVIDSDLEGSTGLKAIHQKHPEVSRILTAAVH